MSNRVHTKLSGYYKIKLRKMGIRIVYKLEVKDHMMKVIVISVRADDVVYKLAEKKRMTVCVF